MRIIDLLNKIAKGEKVPKKIKIENDELYFSKYKNTYVFEKGGNLNWCYYVTAKSLNDEVEIIEEEKEIEKIAEITYSKDDIPSMLFPLMQKINELIDEINKLKRDKE